MLKVDLRQLERTGRLAIDQDVAVDSEFWDDTGITATTPLRVSLAAQIAGKDVLVKHLLSGDYRVFLRRRVHRGG